MPDDVDAALATPSEAQIYTETLARLYLRQGFVTQALTIYRRLAHEQPDNDQLRAHILALEHQLATNALPADTVGEDRAPSVPTRPQGAAPQPAQALLVHLERWLQVLEHRSCRAAYPNPAGGE